MDYAVRWGQGTLWVGKLFAYRATDPNKLYEAEDPVGPGNYTHLRDLLEQSNLVVCAWGTKGNYLDRDREVLEMVGDRGTALMLTKDGHPGHPGRLSKALKPFPYP